MKWTVVWVEFDHQCKYDRDARDAPKKEQSLAHFVIVAQKYGGALNSAAV